MLDETTLIQHVPYLTVDDDTGVVDHPHSLCQRLQRLQLLSGSGELD
jgi:hypothetical protein